MAKPKTTPDPLEAAKGEEPSASIADNNVIAPAAAGAVQPPLADVAEEVSAPPSPEPVIMPPAPVLIARYRVNKDKLISYGSSMVQLRAGKIVSDEMGVRFLDVCREWNVDMTLVE